MKKRVKEWDIAFRIIAAVIVFVVTISVIINFISLVFNVISLVFNVIFFDYIYVTLTVTSLGFFYFLKMNRDKERRHKAAAQAARIEQDRLEALRDSDQQSEPYTYEIGTHGNQTLAIRYGIANTAVETIPYYYFAKGGVKTRNYDRDRKKVVNSDNIKLKKVKRLKGENQFLVMLSGFKNRKAIAIHVTGEEYIRTFYPIHVSLDDVDHEWWQRNPELEAVLKDNKTFTLKEMAKFHVDKTVPFRSR